MDVLITGSSGLIGSALVDSLAAAGHRPIRLVRRPPAANTDEIEWDPAAGRLDSTSLEGADAAVNLAGAGIGDKRWNEAYKQVLLSSRTESTALLATTLASLDRPPKVLLSGSAIGAYSDGFLADLVTRWEAAAQPAVDTGLTTAFLRTGIVLTPDGGALAKLLPLFRFGLGGRMGSGEQYMSWISIDDVVAAINHLLTAGVSGPVNLTAPNPVTNAELTKALASALGRPAILPVPAFGPKLLLGSEMAHALLFESIRVLPDELLASGFEFTDTHIEPALERLL